MTAVTGQNIRSDMKTLLGSFPFFTGDNEIGEGLFDLAIQLAARTFSKYKPRLVVEDEVGDGGSYYDLTILSEWETEFSDIISLDYDAGSRIGDNALPLFLSKDDGDITFYSDASVDYFLLPNHGPASTQTMRITYTAFHLVDSNDILDTLSTIPNVYRNAFTYLAVSELNTAIQEHMEKGIDGPRGAEFTAFRNRGAGFAALATTYFDKFIKEIGGGDGVVPASVTRDFDQVFVTGDRYFFHNSSRQ